VRTRPTVSEQSRPRPVRGETHEPEVPQNWPEGHVSVALTQDELDECIEVTVHGVRHYLHSTTAYELRNMLVERLDEWQRAAELEGYGIDGYERLLRPGPKTS
jgi:hypothetical protein